MFNTAVRHEKKLLLSILVLALALRVWGIGFGLPGLFHADEPIVLNHALAYGTGDFNPHFFKIPPLVSYLLFAVFGVYYLAGRITGLFSGTDDFEHLFYTDPSSFYFLARLLFGALAGTLTVFCLYRVTRRHFGAARALVGAFLLATCFLHVSDSHYLYADIPLLLVMVFAFGLFWNISQESRLFKHLAAGALIGLAAAVKYNGVFLGLFYGVMLLGAPLSRTQKIKSGVLAAGTSALVFTALNPYGLLDFSFFVAELKKQSLSQGGVGWLHNGVYSLPGAVGFPVLLTALAGFAAVGERSLSADERLKRLALLIFTFAYYAVLAGSGQPYPRYVLPLLPGVLFFASDFICRLGEKSRRLWVYGAGVFILAVFPLTKSVLWNQIMNTADTRTQAKDWIEKNIASSSSLALDWDFYMPRLNFTPEQLERKRHELQNRSQFTGPQMRRLEALKKKSSHQPAYELQFLVPKPAEQERFLMATPVIAYDLQALKNKGVHYVLLLPGIRPELAEPFYEQIQLEGQLLRTFSPYRDGREGGFDRVAMTGGPFTWPEIWRRKANGHTICIYQISQESVHREG